MSQHRHSTVTARSQHGHRGGIVQAPAPRNGRQRVWRAGQVGGRVSAPLITASTRAASSKTAIKIGPCGGNSPQRVLMQRRSLRYPLPLSSLFWCFFLLFFSLLVCVCVGLAHGGKDESGIGRAGDKGGGVTDLRGRDRAHLRCRPGQVGPRKGYPVHQFSCDLRAGCSIMR